MPLPVMLLEVAKLGHFCTSCSPQGLSITGAADPLLLSQ